MSRGWSGLNLLVPYQPTSRWVVLNNLYDLWSPYLYFFLLCKKKEIRLNHLIFFLCELLGVEMIQNCSRRLRRRSNDSVGISFYCINTLTVGQWKLSNPTNLRSESETDLCSSPLICSRTEWPHTSGVTLYVKNQRIRDAMCLTFLTILSDRQHGGGNTKSCPITRSHRPRIREIPTKWYLFRPLHPSSG